MNEPINAIKEPAIIFKEIIKPQKCMMFFVNYHCSQEYLDI